MWTIFHGADGPFHEPCAGNSSGEQTLPRRVWRAALAFVLDRPHEVALSEKKAIH
jgi:hypothetical protein